MILYMHYTIDRMSLVGGPAYRSHRRKGPGLRYRMSWNLSLQMRAVSRLRYRSDLIVRVQCTLRWFASPMTRRWLFHHSFGNPDQIRYAPPAQRPELITDAASSAKTRCVISGPCPSSAGFACGVTDWS